MARFARTKFGSWVRAYSVRDIASRLAESGTPTSVQAIYSWLAGRTLPKLTHAARLIEISDGSLSVRDIIEHHTEVNNAGLGERSRTRALAGGEAEGTRRD